MAIRMLCPVCCNYYLLIEFDITLHAFGTPVKTLHCTQNLDSLLKDQDNRDHSKINVSSYLKASRISCLTCTFDFKISGVGVTIL